MNHFKHLHLLVKCPECGADVTSATVRGAHTNGDQFETVSFRCYSSIEYSPNFREQRVIKPCPHSKEQKDRKLKQKEVLLKIHNILIDIQDEDFSKRFLTYNEYFFKDNGIEL